MTLFGKRVMRGDLLITISIFRVKPKNIQDIDEKGYENDHNSIDRVTRHGIWLAQRGKKPP
jgi:hypothetical protein